MVNLVFLIFYFIFWSEMGVNFCQRIFQHLWRELYVLFLRFINMAYYDNNSLILNQPCIHVINPTQSWCLIIYCGVVSSLLIFYLIFCISIYVILVCNCFILSIRFSYICYKKTIRKFFFIFSALEQFMEHWGYLWSLSI